MSLKYRLGNLAKDFSLKNADITDILKNLTSEIKKSNSVLSPGELNYIFEFLTQKNQVDSLDNYFQNAKKSLQQEAIATSTKRKTVHAQEKVIENTKKSSDRIENSTRKSKILGKFNKDLKQNSLQQQNKVNIVQSDNSKINRANTNTNKHPSDSLPNKKVAKRASQKIIALTGNSSDYRLSDESSAKMVIDTKANHTNIDKYNEKYDSIAQEKVKTDAFTARKQKINSRSQYRDKRSSKKRETEAERLKRIENERKARNMTISIPEKVVVSDLATKLKASGAEVVKKLMMLGTMATVNDTIDFDTASLIAMEFHAKTKKEKVFTIEEKIIDDKIDDEKDLKPRAPVVVVMGHVDHGKTSLLDAYRSTNVISTEAGGITQHIGAYSVKLHDRDITFLDTPGHEAFTTMRARGAQITDIAILVVAADDGVMPQTVEAINHAKSANIPIICAINKIDKPDANPERIMQQLSENGLIAEEWGGDVPCIKISAKQKTGLDELLEMVLLVADMNELKANPDRTAKGTVIEARLDKGRGPVATVLIQNGTLKSGDLVVAGTAYGKVRVMVNDKGMRIRKAGPSTPVEITGLDTVPNGGDSFNVVSNDRLAKELVEQRRHTEKERIFNSKTKVTLENVFSQMKLGEMKKLDIIVKADVRGSAEAIKQSLEKLSNDEVRVEVIHQGVGSIRESDIMLAAASNAIVVGFNVRPDATALESAANNNVDVRTYRVIYECVNEINSAIKGMLAPEFREVVLGRAECRVIYKISSVGTISGSYVSSGKITRTSSIRVIRDGVVIAEDKISSLRRFKDDVKEVQQGYECGIGLENFNDIKENDVLEAFEMQEFRPE